MCIATKPLRSPVSKCGLGMSMARSIRLQTHWSWRQSYPEFSQHSRKQVAIQIRAFLRVLCPANHLIQFNLCPKPIGLGDNPTQNLASIPENKWPFKSEHFYVCYALQTI
jgi:hypothetical protein